MFIEVVKSKIHRVTVTQANLNYIGSITIDEDLMDMANIIATKSLHRKQQQRRTIRDLCHKKANEVQE